MKIHANIELWDIVEVLQQKPENKDICSKFAVVCAMREEDGRHRYVVTVCAVGVGLNCPEGKHFIFGAEEIRSTGKKSFPAAPADGPWPLPSLPKFQLYQKVQVLNHGFGETAIARSEGVVCDVPTYYDTGWWYSVSICDNGDDCECDWGWPVYDVDEAKLCSEGGWSRQYYRMLARPPKLAHNEMVVIVRTGAKDSEMRGKLGVVRGSAQEADGQWGYDVEFYDVEDLHGYDEDALLGTGEFDDKDTFSGVRLRVSQSAASVPGRNRPPGIA